MSGPVILMKSLKIFLVAALLASAGARASTLDALIADLAGGDEIARVRARMLLPREDVLEVTAKVIPLVQQDNPAVWQAAFNVLMDLSAEVALPGREAERAGLAREVMALLAEEKPAAMKERGLRLLPFVVPAGADLAPVAALLAGKDAKLAEKARAALQEIATPEARAELREHLPKATAELQCGILNALGALKDAAALTGIESLCKSADPRVRAAAARALSWTGDPFRLAMVKQVIAQADDATRREAHQALLRLLNAIEEKGGNWEIAVAGYRELLASADQAIKDGALAGLGRIGDGTCVAPVLAAIHDADAPTRLVGLAALREMQGVDVARALVVAYPRQGMHLQGGMLEAMASKKHPIVLPTLIEASKSDNPWFRIPALKLLGDTELAEALPALLETASKAGMPEVRIARTAILKIADSLRAGGRNKEAGPAYLAALQTAKDDDSRRVAIEGLTACPVPEALPALQALTDRKELSAPTARALVATAKVLTAAKKKPEAIAALEAARSLDASPELAKQILAGLREAGAAGDYAAMLGLITHWWVVGPFELGENQAGWEKAHLGEPEVSLTGRYMSGKRRVEWTPAKAPDDRGVIDLHKALGPGDNLVGYAYTEVTVEKDTDAVLLLGVDDSERVWVNGKKVFEHFVARPLTPDQDAVPVRLKAGTNTILLKIWQNTMGWEFCARLTAPDGKPIAFTQKAR